MDAKSMRYLIFILLFTIQQDTIKSDTIVPKIVMQQNEIRDDMDSISIYINQMIRGLKSDTIK